MINQENTTVTKLDEAVILENKEKWASFMHNKGYPIISIHGVEKGQCFCPAKSACSSPGKHPILGHTPFSSEDDVRMFWESYPKNNYAILTKDLVVIDVDARKGGLESFKVIESKLKDLKTIKVITGSGDGSFHLYYKLPFGIKLKNNSILPGIDIKSTGGYVVGPGCSHKSGNFYIVDDVENTKFEINELPDLPLDFENYVNFLSDTGLLIDKEKPIGRNITLFEIAWRLSHQGLSESEILNHLVEENKKFDKPLDLKEVMRVAKSASRYKKTKAKIEWEKPDLDFKIKNESFDDITEDMLHPSIKNFTLKAKANLGVPLLPIAVLLYGFISSILGSAFRCRVSMSSSFRIVLSLWTILIAPPSSKKTPIFELVQDVMLKIENFYNHKRKEFADNKLKEISDLKVSLKLIKNSKSESDIEKMKTLETKLAFLQTNERNLCAFFTSDATPEGLTQLFKYNYRGVLLLRDELGGLLASLSKKSYEQMRGLLTESWNGGKPYKTSRKGEGEVQIDSCTLAIMGGVQPDLLKDYFYNEIQRGSSSDGLLARFQLAAIFSIANLKAPNNFTVFDSEKIEFESNMMKLHELTIDYNLGKNKNPIELVLSDTACEKYNEIDAYISNIVKKDYSENQAYISHISKFNRLALSLSAQFQIMDSVTGNKPVNSSVSYENMDLAFKWIKFLDKQAQRMYINFSKNNAAKVLVNRIRDGSITDGLSVRSVYKKGWAGLKDSSDVLAAIESISESNWVKVEIAKPKTGGRESEVIRLNPELIVWLKENTKA